MFLSFLIIAQNNQTKLLKTLISIKEQTSDDYEVVLIDDSGFQPKSPVLEFMNECFYNNDNNGKKIQVITNLWSQGFSYGINAAIAIANGDFFMIVEEGQTINKLAVEILKEKIVTYQVDHKKIDMIEFQAHYIDSNEKSEIWNKTNVLLSPKPNREILAYVNCALFSKVFRRKFILQKNVTLLDYRRTDAFFIYHALVYTEGFLAIKDVLVDYELGVVNYSVFDLIKQWIYIFNLYRDLNLYREYQEELEYAFIRFCLVTFLDIVSLQNNKRLSIKAIHSAENKLERRYKSFLKNKYIKNIKDSQFKMIVANIKGYIKNWKIENTKKMMTPLADKKNSSQLDNNAFNPLIIKNNSENYTRYQLVRPIRIILIRFFDIILASLIPLILTLTMKYWDYNYSIWAPILIISLTFILFFLYFVIIPYFWDGKTIGKFCFRIKLVTKAEKLKLSVIFTRELFITFLPWFVVLITNLSCNLIFQVSFGDLFWTTNKNPIALIIIRTITTIYFFWYLGLIFGLMLNPHHQILFDRHFQLFNVKKTPIIKKGKKVPKELIIRETKHIHLQDNQPGNISDEVLKEINDL